MVAIGVFAQSNGITIFKPDTPRVISVKSYEAPIEKITPQIQAYAATGWVIKSVTYGRSSGNDDKVIVVYEKY